MSNPTPASGGESQESVGEASREGSERLRHRDRAVTADDFMRLALEEFPIIGRAVIAVGIVGSLVLTTWMLSDIKGPRGRVGPDPVLQLATNTATAVPVSPTPAPPEATATDPVMATDRPAASPTAKPPPMEINFNADRYSIVQGECTTLRWQVVGAEIVLVQGVEVEATEAEQVCPSISTSYTLIAKSSQESKESSFLIEVVAATATEGPMGCTGYDQNGQLVCKETCTDNDPKDPCTFD